jgi:hypothetical protein
MAAGFRTGSGVTSGSLNLITANTQTLGGGTPATIVVGDRIIVTAVFAAASLTPTIGFTDNRNTGAYTIDASVNYTLPSGDHARFVIASHTVTVGGTTQVSVSSSPAAYGGFSAAAYTGLLASDPGGDVAQAASGTTATASSGATAANTLADELVIGAYGDLGEGTAVAMGGINGSTTGCVLRVSHINDGNQYQGLLFDKLDSGSTLATQTATATGTGAVEWGCGCVVYKLVASNVTYPLSGSVSQAQSPSVVRVPLITYHLTTTSASQAQAAALTRVPIIAPQTYHLTGSATVHGAPYSLALGTFFHVTLSATQPQTPTRAFVVAHRYTLTLTSATQAQSLSLATVTVGHPFIASVSTSGRYLLDQYAQPYFIQGSSPQLMCSQLGTTDMATYFADVASRGVNSCQIHLMANDGIWFQLNSNSANVTDPTNPPFSNMATLSGTNAAYWARVDTMFDLAAQKGITVWASPCENISYGGTIDGMTLAQCQSFGTFIGTRYAARPNIVWSFGNDYTQWTRDPKYNAVLTGIRNAGDTHLVTTWFLDNGNSWDDTYWDTIHQTVLGYSYGTSYTPVERGYAHTGAGAPQPVFFGEGNYEGENNKGYAANANAETLRRTAWWAITYGGCGHFYGQHTTWSFFTGWQTDPTSGLNSPGAQSMAKIGPFMHALTGWQNLLPDTAGTLITAGAGTHDTTNGYVDPLTNNFATAAITADKKLALIYVPTVRAWTVNTSGMAGTPNGTWFDPTTGTTSAAPAPYTIPPTAHSDGAHDWVLVLQVPPPPVIYYLTVTVAQAQAPRVQRRAVLSRTVTQAQQATYRQQILLFRTVSQAQSPSVTTLTTGHGHPFTGSATVVTSPSLTLARSSPPHALTVSASIGQSLSLSSAVPALLQVMWDPATGTFRTSGTYPLVQWPGAGGQFEETGP